MNNTETSFEPVSSRRFVTGTERLRSTELTGPNELSIRDPSAVNALLGPSGVQKGPRKFSLDHLCLTRGTYPPISDFFGRLLKADTLTMVALQDTEEHLRRRRAWLRGFSPTALKEYEPLIARRAVQLRDRLLQVTNEAKDGRPVALDEWFNFFSYALRLLFCWVYLISRNRYDFMSDMAFGGGSELLSGEEEDRFWTVMEDNMR